MNLNYLTFLQPHGLLKPMESKTFTFSFRSADKPGMFTEEWELITDPQTLTKLPLFYLSGMATQNDDQRQAFIQETLKNREEEVTEYRSANQCRDELEMIKWPEPPKPDIREVTYFQQEFEKNNRHIGVYFSPAVHSQLFELLEDIIERAPALQEQEGGI